MDKINIKNQRKAAAVIPEAKSVAAVPDGSRLSDAFNPVSMRGTPTVDPNLMARGQINQTSKDRGQEVFGPFDRVFASKGGIMSTNKAFQRVA